MATILLALPPVESMAELTEALRTARTLDDLLEAEREHRQPKTFENMRIRKRLLQEQGLEDSEPILANSFGGEPGFFHGVASGESDVVRYECINCRSCLFVDSFLTQMGLSSIASLSGNNLNRGPIARRRDCVDALHSGTKE